MKKIFLLQCLICLWCSTSAQQTPYGNNPAAGKYFQTSDARLYYEVYGAGPPLLLLHGDVFGYIDEFALYLPMLSQHYKVIAIGTRGHGKSELGERPLSNELLAGDVLAILQQESADSATVVGFSAGAILGYYLAAYHPAKIKKVVALAGALGLEGMRQETIAEQRNMTVAALEKKYPDFIKARKQLMPQPERYQELIDKLKVIWFEKYHVTPDKAQSIQCPVLTVGGDRDYYFGVENFVDIYRTVPHSQLAIIPHCDHVGLILNPDMFKAVVMPFLLNGQ